MPKATPELRRLRIKAAIKTGPFAELADYDRNAYSNVEHGRRPASPEAFQRFADVLSARLTERRGELVTVEAHHLYVSDERPEGEQRREHVSPQSLPPARPPHEPKRPPNKRDTGTERGAA